MSNVSVDRKRVFMNFLLKNVFSQGDEGYRIIYTFNKYERFAERVRFVEDAKVYPDGIKISGVPSGDTEFLFYKQDEIITRSFGAFEHFDENTEKPIYIQINFAGKYSNELYLDVVEDEDCTLTPYLNEEDQAEIDRMIKYQLIDYALDKKNEEMFRELVSN
ncbi:YpiB family protein [Bacillus mycoides]|uniref:YpiB family protein n=1 Tax=Bacillus mycoides TaxID=1405 RepID=UPI002111864F|nr:YpiB family protein [Bacillus mycoides]MCQ6527881.1 YpiB family protein [Bacillus mycoides]